MKFIFSLLAVLSLPSMAFATVVFEFEQIVVREMQFKESPARSVSFDARKFRLIKETSEVGISFRVRQESNEIAREEFLGLHSFPLDLSVPQVWLFKGEEKEPFQYLFGNIGPVNDEEYAVIHNAPVSEVITEVALAHLAEQFPSLNLNGIMEVTNEHGPAECTFGEKGDLFCQRIIRSKFIFKSQQFEYLKEKGIDPLDLFSETSEGA